MAASANCARRSARAFGLDPARIVCGAGSDDLLNLLARAYPRDGDEAIYTTHGFLVYPIAALGTGAQADRCAGKELHRRCRRHARGGDAKNARSYSSPIRTTRPAPTCRSTRSSGCTGRCRANVLLVLDAAYAEYVQRNDYEAGIELVGNHG